MQHIYVPTESSTRAPPFRRTTKSASSSISAARSVSRAVRSAPTCRGIHQHLHSCHVHVAVILAGVSTTSQAEYDPIEFQEIACQSVGSRFLCVPSLLRLSLGSVGRRCGQVGKTLPPVRCDCAQRRLIASVKIQLQMLRREDWGQAERLMALVLQFLLQADQQL